MLKTKKNLKVLMVSILLVVMTLMAVLYKYLHFYSKKIITQKSIVLQN